MQPTLRRPRPAPPPPTLNEARIRAESEDRLRRRQGHAATFLSTASGRSEGGVATRMLWG
jgi:hypothetical protein